MRHLALFVAIATCLLLAGATTPVLAQTYHNLAGGDLTEDWSNTGQITTNDDWSGVASIRGFRGDGLTSANDVDPQTVLDADDPGVEDVIANLSATTLSNGGVGEFEIPDPTIGLQGSSTADAPYIKLYLNSVGRQSVSVAFNARDIDLNDDSTQQLALHYRVGASGTWTNVPAAYIADATLGGSATQVTAVNVTLPAACDNEAQVEVRIMTTNASGADEWIGIDDIVVSSLPGGTITAFTNNGAPNTVQPAGTPDVLMIDVSVQTATGTDALQGFVVTHSAGTGVPASEIAAVDFMIDANMNGMPDDAVVQTQTFSGTDATFSFAAGPLPLSTTPVRAFILYDVAGGVANGTTFTAQISSVTVTNTTSGIPMTAATLTIGTGGPTTDFTTNAVGAQTELPGTADVLMIDFEAATSTGTDTLTGFDVTHTGSGTPATEITSVGFMLDANLNGLPDDTITDTATFSGTTASFTGLSVTIGTLANRYFVLYTIAGGATASNTFTAAITNVSVTNTPTGLPINGATLTIQTGASSTAFATNSPSNQAVTNGTLNVVVADFNAVAAGGAATLDNITLTLTGTGLGDTEVDEVSLILDSDASGTVTFADTRLAADTGFTGGTVTLTPGNVISSTAVNMLVMLSFAESVSSGATFTVEITSATMSSGTTTGTPVAGATATVTTGFSQRDIQIMGFSASSGAPEAFAFVPWVNLPSSQVLLFTDHAWMEEPFGVFEGVEGVFEWTAPVAGIAAGTVVVIDVAAATADLGTVVTVGAAPSLFAGDDQIFIVTGSIAQPRLIHLINFGGNALLTSATGPRTDPDWSYVPTSLNATGENFDFPGAGELSSNGQVPVADRTGQTTFAAYQTIVEGFPGTWLMQAGTGIMLDSDDFVLAGAGIVSTFTANTAPAVNAAQNDVNVLAMDFEVSTNAGTANITGMELLAGGSGDPATGLSSVRLVQDNGDGVLGSGDITIFSSAGFTTNPLSLTGLSIGVSTTAVRLFVVFDISGTVVVGSDFTVTIQNISVDAGTTSTPGTFIGATVTIVTATTGGTGSSGSSCCGVNGRIGAADGNLVLTLALLFAGILIVATRRRPPA